MEKLNKTDTQLSKEEEREKERERERERERAEKYLSNRILTVV